MLSGALSAIRNKYEDARVSVDEKELVAALIAAALKGYLNSINILKGKIEVRHVAGYCQRDSKGNAKPGLDAKGEKHQIQEWQNHVDEHGK